MIYLIQELYDLPQKHIICQIKIDCDWPSTCLEGDNKDKEQDSYEAVSKGGRNTWPQL